MLHKVASRAGRRHVARILAVLTLVFAVGLAMLPTASLQAASSSAAAESASYNGRWYTVQAGDTLGEIARYTGTTVSQIMNANGLSSSRIYVGQQLWIPSATVASSCTTTYVVQQGDNLSRIARAYGINVNALASANGLTNASLIYPGQKICIPNIWSTGGSSGHSGGCYYTVQQGDNLSRIAAKFGTTYTYLAEVNHLSNPRVIIPGQRLYVC
jgi:lysozyme